jgi:integrase/recombinase XerD
MRPQEPGDLLDAAIKRYLLNKQALDEDTVAYYRRALNVYRKTSPGWPPDTEGVIAFILHCQSVYEDSTTFSYWAVIKAFIGWLVRRRYIADDPLLDLSPPGKPDDVPRAPPVAQLKSLFDYLEGEVERVILGTKRYPYWGWREVRNLAFFSLLLDSGLRVQEACNVRLEDVNLAEWSIFVRHAKQKKQRFVAIGRTVRADLKFWLQYRSLIPMRDDSPGKDHLFVSRYRGWGPMTIFNAGDMLQRICCTLAIEPALTSHQLRHSYVAYSLLGGGSIEEIRKQAGHSSLATTARYMRHLDNRRLQDHLKSSPRDHLF